ncbi:MAG: XdhC family protein [Anaerolineae bacterium]
MLDILQTVDQWLREKRSIALATVVDTWGSAPRRPGSKMAVTSEMAMVGSVSGGCVETAVIEQALECLSENNPRLLNYGVSDDDAWEVGLTCGGKISIYVEPLDEGWWRTAADYVRRDQQETTLISLEADTLGRKILLDKDGGVQYNTLGADLKEALAAAQNVLRPQLAEVSGHKLMVDIFAPRPHLIIIGGVHIAQPLQTFAHHMGFRVSIVDPRGVFATADRFPYADSILNSYPDKALPQLGLDRNTFVAVLTHDPKIDDKALLTALPSPAPYIGVLSSRKTHIARTERLKSAGMSDDLIGRISTPIGVDIDAQNPEEIALSIMAQVISVRNQVMKPQPAAQALS